MKHYKRVLELISVNSTYKSFHNALVKVRINTEDEWLQDLISTHDRIVSKRMNRYPSNSKAYRESQISLKLYCEQTIKAAKQEWQKIAERKGWTYVGK